MSNSEPASDQSNTQNNKKKRSSEDTVAKIQNAFYIAVGIGLSATILFSLSSSFAEFAAHLGCAMLIASASLLTGGILGFLFGIPRTLQRDVEFESENRGRNSSDQVTHYRANTNLEQISDWLKYASKSWLAWGLPISLTEIPSHLRSFGKYASPALGHSEAAYLKDQTTPNYAEAEKMLTEAIQRRNRAGKKGYHLYELNRAICRIQMDVNYLEENSSSDPSRESILQDLKKVWAGPNKSNLESDPIITKWRSLNPIDLGS